MKKERAEGGGPTDRPTDPATCIKAVDAATPLHARSRRGQRGGGGGEFISGTRVQTRYCTTTRLSLASCARIGEEEEEGEIRVQ